MNTTTNDSITERALFLMHGDFDGKNDFGFHITYGMPYLAAEFLEIDAVWNNNGNALVTWSTANETNSSHYVVERSSDANTYKAVGIVDAVGESHEKLDYGFIDITANEVDSKTIYYRIQEVNYNGNPSYSGVAVLTKELVRNTVVYPNPIKDNINVNYNAYGEYTIEITSITGHTLLQLEGFKPDEYSPIRIDGLGQLPQGIYFLRVRHNGIDSVTKFFL
jgi:hypothetical protein